MKIGIVTFWQSNDNYGQLLQAFALQKHLKMEGHKPFIIKYNFDERITKRPLWKLFIKSLLIFPLLKQIRQVKKEKTRKKELKKKNKVRKFDLFRETYIEFSEKNYNSLKELRLNPPLADLYIVGSDQVWAQSLQQKENEVFFLNFGHKNTKKISYAASFAMTSYPKKLISKLHSRLCKFHAISVREYDGVNICKNAKIKSVQVIDPTLLLDKKIYLGMITSKEKYAKHIYIYSINILFPEEIEWDNLCYLADEENSSLVVTPSCGYIEGKEIFGSGVNYDYPTIEGWLANIYHSSLFVTTSFHGIVFSIILQKKFAYIPLSGMFQKGNNRVVDLLSKLGLEDRIYKKPYTYKELFYNEIDWNTVGLKLDKLKIFSSSFLSKHIN